MSQTKAQLIDPVDGTITNADISSGASDRISGTKISPDFGSQNIATTGSLGSGNITVTGTAPSLFFTESDADPDYQLLSNSGVFKIHDVTNSADKYLVASSGMIHTFNGTASFSSNLDVGAGVDVTGNITGTGDIVLSSGGTERLNMTHVGGGQFVIKNPSAASLTFGTNNQNNELVIANGGNVGIGLSTGIDRKLHVKSSGLIAKLESTSETSAIMFATPNNETANTIPNIGASTNDLVFTTGNLSRLTIDSTGRLLVGTANPGNSGADDLTIQAPSGSAGGITIRSDTDQGSYIYFADGTSGDTQYRGFIQYLHGSDYFNIGTSSTDRFIIGPLGQVGIGSTSAYGNAGEAFISQGANAAPQWASPKDVTIGSSIDLTTVNGGNNQNYVYTGIPNTVYHIRLVYADLSSHSSSGGTNDLPILRVGNSGGIKTSGYRGWTVYNYWGQTSSYSPVVTTETTYCPLWARQWHSGAYHMNGFVDLHRVYCDSNNVNSQWVMSGQNRIDSSSDGNGNWWGTTNDGIQRNTEWFFNSAFNFTGGETLERIELNANISGTSATFDTGVIKLYYWS